MITNDLAIKYRNLYQEVELMIENVNDIGFNMDEYIKEINTINSEVSTNIKEHGVTSFMRASYENYYSVGIKRLNEIKFSLEKYNVYYKVLYSCNYIDDKINDREISNEILDKYVSEMIYNLKQIVKSETMDYDNEKHIIEIIYEVAYKLIKLEIIKNGESQLYLFCKHEEANISYFDKLIKKEINKYDLDDKKYSVLRNKIFEIKRKGIEANYFDLDLIKYLLYFNNDYNLKDATSKKLNDICKEIKDNYAMLLEDTDNLSMRKNSLKVSKDYINDEWKEFRERIITVVLALSLMISGGIFVKNSAKKLANLDNYTKRTEVYSTIDDETHVLESDIMWLTTGKPSDTTKIRVYDEYKNSRKRKYEYYNVSDYEFESAKDYYDYGLDNYHLKPEEGTLRSSDEGDICEYPDEYTEVEKISYIYKGKKFSNSDYIGNLILFYIGYIVLLIAAEGIYCIKKDRSLIKGNIEEIYYTLDEIYTEKKQYANLEEELIRKENEVIEEINKHEELCKLFNDLYEENKYLLDRPEELMKKLDRIYREEKIENAKTLVREKK